MAKEIPRTIPDELYLLIERAKIKRYGLLDNIEKQADYAHGQCDTIEIIEEWLSKL